MGMCVCVCVCACVRACMYYLLLTCPHDCISGSDFRRQLLALLLRHCARQNSNAPYPCLLQTLKRDHALALEAGGSDNAKAAASSSELLGGGEYEGVWGDGLNSTGEDGLNEH